MGGNVTVRGIDAEKIQFKNIPIKQFRTEFLDLFKTLNNLYYRKFKEYIWKDISSLTSGIAFNGSTQFIMNPDLDPDEIMKYKLQAGDVDITVPEECGKNLWLLLKPLEDKQIANFTYIGNNRNNEHAIGDQINAIFQLTTESGVTNCQVDFEFLPYENGKPTEWASFSHGSSFEDAKAGVKSAFHKLLLRAVVGSMSENPNIVIATKASTYDKIKLKKDDGTIPRMQQFSVTRGLGTGLEPMLDPDGKPVFVNGKQVYKEAADHGYETNLQSIFDAVFKKGTVKQMYSFVGVCELLRTQPKTVIKSALNRFIQILFGKGAQPIEATSKELDCEVKFAAYNKFVEIVGVKYPDIEDVIENYYSTMTRFK